jgi:hypothetical protein
MAVAIAVILNIDVFKAHAAQVEFASTVGVPVELPQSDSNVRFMWIMN